MNSPEDHSEAEETSAAADAISAEGTETEEAAIDQDATKHDVVFGESHHFLLSNITGVAINVSIQLRKCQKIGLIPKV
jgi:hypothetical protein